MSQSIIKTEEELLSNSHDYTKLELSVSLPYIMVHGLDCRYFMPSALKLNS